MAAVQFRHALCNRGLSTAQLVLGLSLIQLDLLGVYFETKSVDFMASIGANIWTGVFFIITGLVGLCAPASPTENGQRHVHYTAILVLSFIGALLTLNDITASIVALFDGHDHYHARWMAACKTAAENLIQKVNTDRKWPESSGPTTMTVGPNRDRQWSTGTTEMPYYRTWKSGRTERWDVERQTSGSTSTSTENPPINWQSVAAAMGPLIEELNLGHMAGESMQRLDQHCIDWSGYGPFLALRTVSGVVCLALLVTCVVSLTIGWCNVCRRRRGTGGGETATSGTVPSAGLVAGSSV